MADLLEPGPIPAAGRLLVDEHGLLDLALGRSRRALHGAGIDAMGPTSEARDVGIGGIDPSGQLVGAHHLTYPLAGSPVESGNVGQASEHPPAWTTLGAIGLPSLVDYE